jgi:hypothetical protein
VEIRDTGGFNVQQEEFDEFVKRQQGGATLAVSVDWNKERDEWLGHLKSLYSKIESLLKKYTSAGQIRFEYRKVELTEEQIGSYSATQMNLWIGRQEVLLMPIGTLLVGAKGRVDVIGPLGRAEILLVDRLASSPGSLIHVSFGVGGKVPPAPRKAANTVSWEWKIVTRPPERRFVEVTQQSIFQLIMEVTNG